MSYKGVSPEYLHKSGYGAGFCPVKTIADFQHPQIIFTVELKLVEGKLKIALLAQSESGTVLNN
jgi:hypothetical protein